MQQKNKFLLWLTDGLHGFSRYIGSFFYDPPQPVRVSETLPLDEEEDEFVPARPVEELKQVVEQWVAERYYTDPDLTVEQTLAQMGISVSELNYYLFSVLHVNGFRRWIPFLRIEEAKRLLIEKPFYTFDAIAVECGYSNRSTFSRSFKTQEGISPSEWLKRAKTSDSDNKSEVI